MTICAVFGCKINNDKRRINNPDNVGEVSFCRFPRNEKLRKVWLYLCGRYEDCQAKRLFVCMKHFEREDYVRNLRHELLNYFPKSSRKIKIDAIPRLFLAPNVVVPPRSIPESEIKNNYVAQSSKKDKIIRKENLTNPAAKSIRKRKKTIAPTLETSLNTSSDFANSSTPTRIDLKTTQLEFVDHVVMVYLNRCRSRAGNINVGMPHYILRGKAQEAAILLGTKHEDRFHWIPNFKKKLAENDAKGIVLTTTPESLSIADIIKDEWPKFANEKGLDIGEDEDSEDTLSALDEEEYSMKTQNVTPINDEDETLSISPVLTPAPVPTPAPVLTPVPVLMPAPAHDCSRPISPEMEETCEDAHSQTSEKHISIIAKIQESAAEDTFLKHLLMAFIGRFNATWPQADIPGIILNAKFREAAMLLCPKIRNKNVWLCAFKNGIKRKSLSETISIEPNQSLDIKDIIVEEWPKFKLENNIASADGNDLEEEIIFCETNTVDKSERNNVESSDTLIQTYEEARDCLKLLSNYALDLGDLNALSLIKKVDLFLITNDCEE